MMTARRNAPPRHVAIFLAVACVAGAANAQPAASPRDEDGSKLWLRYANPGSIADRYRDTIKQIVVAGDSETAAIIREEINTGCSSMLGSEVVASEAGTRDGAVVIGTPATSRIVRELKLEDELRPLGDEGFILRTMPVNGHRATVVASRSERGALYGTYHLLRLMQTGEPIAQLAIAEKPRVQLRMLNHWDNLNGTVERGYAGRSLWQWDDLPDDVSPRYREYARVNAAVGINGVAVNNVNADARVLTDEYLQKARVLADIFRPYGIRLYLSCNFAAPVTLGGLETADPLDEGVKQWWADKADEIYTLIPDFGGFLVKANSEGQPGPKDYNRTHAEGAQVLADALAPHHGTVIWRAFIYDEEVDPDRANRAYIEFTRLEGKFRPNVLLQIKNGTIDFQPREPFHPLFGGLRKTPAIAELQPTQEYLGQARHLVYLGPQWEEFLDADTYADGEGSTVGEYLAGEIFPMSITGMAGVANPGQNANWCGHHFSQANWYAFARLAWNYELSAEEIAEEWVRQTFTNDAATVDTIREMMMESHETYVNYTMPLGLHHLIGGDHYAPMPENSRAPRADWTATYYHQAASDGIGFDRTASGSNHVGQYHPPLRERFASVEQCPEKHLLWFHHLPWDHEMKSGRTLWEELCTKYFEGVRGAERLQATWASLEGQIDARRHREVAQRLEEQVAHAKQWRDHILSYFQDYSGREIYIPESG